MNDLIDSNQVMQKVRGRLVLQMQGLSFLGKVYFRFLQKNGSQETLNILSVSN